MNQEILAWLRGVREYNQGVALYKKYGHNKVLQNTFSKGHSKTNAEMLEYELGRLVGLNQTQINQMPRTANTAVVETEKEQTNPVEPEKVSIDNQILALAKSLGVTVDVVFSAQKVETATDEQNAALEQIQPVLTLIPETQKQIIRFRERYPFLGEPDCPNELKILVADMFSAYDKFREARALLSEENTDETNANLAAETVEKYLENRAMWAELDYYKENGKILGEHKIFAELNLQTEIKALSDIDLVKKQNTARGNVTKNQQKLDAATADEDKAKYGELLSKWKNILELCNTELEARKNA